VCAGALTEGAPRALPDRGAVRVYPLTRRPDRVTSHRRVQDEPARKPAGRNRRSATASGGPGHTGTPRILAFYRVRGRAGDRMRTGHKHVINKINEPKS